MSKQRKAKLDKQNVAAKPTSTTSSKGSAKWHLPLLPIPLIVFAMVWLWAAYWQGDVFRMVRENSFFAPSELLMHFELQKSYGVLWCIGRALLTTFRYPIMGGALLAFILTADCWLLGYAMRLTPRWRWIQYLPLVAYVGQFTYVGTGNYLEAETGQTMGIPFCILCILSVWGIMIRSFSKKPVPNVLRQPTDETPLQNRLQAGVAVMCIALPMVWAHYCRPYVRPIAAMQVAVMNQDWAKVKKIAHDNDELSYRPIAANYAIALVQTGEIGESFFDIRLDYDSLYCPGFNGNGNPLHLYEMECDYYAGLVQTAYHHAMERMAIEGPSLRNLKMLCKTSLLKGEWDVAEKYLSIIDRTPFEGDFVDKYTAWLKDTTAIEADSEVAMIRQLEPIHDGFENLYVQPTFLGYNAALMEGRSINALHNSLMVNIYTKSMQPFLMRCEPLRGTTPPTSVSQALLVMTSKNPALMNQYRGLEMYSNQLYAFIDNTKQYMGSHEERAAHARELFPKYKGYYPYYYFFGNLKATKRKDTKQSSNAGVN